jgi:hypothetical protein
MSSYLRVIEHVQSGCRQLLTDAGEMSAEADRNDPDEAMGRVLAEIHRHHR